MMRKIYALTHTHKLDCYHEDIKILGFFASYDEAFHNIDFYKKLPGFRDSSKGFCIKTYILNTLDQDALQELKNKEFLPKKSVVYSLYRITKPEDKLIAVFSSKQEAYQILLENCKKSSSFQKLLSSFYLEEETVQ